MRTWLPASRNRIAVAIAGCCLAFGQTAWKFEVASVKPAAGGPRGPSATLDPGMVSFRNTNLKNLLMRAYGLRNYQIQGPGWIETERYDVVAKVPDGAPPDQVPAMLRNLLAVRFQLLARRETREESVFVLSVGKNVPKLTNTTMDITSGLGLASNLPANDLAYDAGRLQMRGVTVAMFANTLATLLGYPVLDETGIEGRHAHQLREEPHALFVGLALHGRSGQIQLPGIAQPPRHAERRARGCTFTVKRAIYLRPQVGHSRRRARVHHVEGHGVVQPVVAGPSAFCVATVSVYCCGVSQHSTGEIDLQFVARLEIAQAHAFQARVGAVDVHADARADQDSHHGVRLRLVEARAHAHGDRLAARNRRGRLAARVQDLDAEDLAAAIAMAEAGVDAVVFLASSTPLSPAPARCSG
jgi:uncharacterized protein (TIGR03435 family)